MELSKCKAEPSVFAPHFGQLKRLGITAAVIVVGLAMLRILWGLEAWRRLNAEIEQYRAAGQMVDVEEFDAALDKVPLSRNAADLYEKAFDGIAAFTSDGLSFDDFRNDQEDFEFNIPAARELMESNAAVLKLVHKASNLPEAAWSLRVSRTDSTTAYYSWQRTLAKLLRFASDYYFRTGDHARAVATLQDFLAFDDAVDSHPEVISNLMARSCYALAFKLIEDNGAALQIAGDDEDLTEGIIPAPRGDVERLLARLLSEEPTRRHAVQAYHGSRARDLHALKTSKLLDHVQPATLGIMGVSPLRQSANTLFHPVFVRETTRLVRYDTMSAEAVSQETWLGASTQLPRDLGEPVEANLLYRLTHPFTYTPFGFAYDSRFASARSFFQALARRRMAAVALAIRLYQVDHGERPTELAALVPEYLARAPRDPFAVDEISFGYKPFVERPFLYSVGSDGRDNHGQDAYKPDGKRDNDRSDIRFYLEPDLNVKPQDTAGAVPIVPQGPSVPEADDRDKY